MSHDDYLKPQNKKENSILDLESTETVDTTEQVQALFPSELRNPPSDE
jgi:hypothetical protein